MRSDVQQGKLFGLGPDSVGYIAAGERAKSYGFVLENLGMKGTFSDLGWKDGQTVSFRLDARGRVSEVRPEPARKG